MSALHEELHRMIDEMDDHRAEKALEILRTMQNQESEMTYIKPSYRAEDDPILNGTLYIDGPEDLSETFEDIVKAKIRGKLWQNGE